MKWAIVIPSKGRPKSSTFALLKKYYQDLATSTYVCVEPQDEIAYRELNPEFNIIVLPENNKGISYSRKYYSEYLFSKGYDYVFMIDDDIKSFYKKEKDFKYVNPKSRSKLFEEGLEVAQKNNISLMGISFAYMTRFFTEPIRFGGDACTFVLANLHDLMAIGGYDTNLILHSDTDLNIRLIKAEKKVAVWFEYCFSTSVIGRNEKGKGCASAYKKTKLSAELMQKKHGSRIITLWQKKGDAERVRIRTNWSKIYQSTKNLGGWLR